MTDAPPAPRGLDRVQSHLKQIVFGGNDGIVTTFAIVAGFAGAQAGGVGQIGGLAVLVFGLANLFADGVSMGLGEFLSARSRGDLYVQQRRSRMQRLTRDPGAEAGTLARYFTQRGLPAAEAAGIADRLAQHPAAATELIMVLETGMSDPAQDSPARDGIVTFLSFAVFGAVPLAPYLAGWSEDRALALSVAATLLALTALGALRWRATGDRPLRAVGETVSVGGLCAVIAFVVGRLVAG